MSWRTITEQRPLRAMLAGAGPMGCHWARTLLEHPDTDLVGWADLDLARIAAAAARLGRPTLLASPHVAVLLDRARPDVLVNCTHPAAHPEVSIAALERGVHVLTEKPMAPTLAQARAMSAAADRAGLLLMVSQNRRYLPGMRALREAAAHLGAISMITVEFFIPHPAGGYLRELGEPLLQEMGIHLFDAARAITAADPESVYCEAFRTPWSPYAGNDSATAIFRMSGGTRFTFTGGWSLPGHPTSWTGAWRVAGQHGTVLWDGENAPHEDIGGVRQLTECAPPGEVFTELGDVLDELVRALRTSATPQGECHDNLHSLAMVGAAAESARTRRPVEISVSTPGATAPPGGAGGG